MIGGLMILKNGEKWRNGRNRLSNPTPGLGWLWIAANNFAYQYMIINSVGLSFGGISKLVSMGRAKYENKLYFVQDQKQVKHFV